MTKSEGVKDIVKWMEGELKKKQAEIDEMSQWPSYTFEEGESMERRITKAQTQLEQMLSWKVSTEKYMKKLRHQGE